MPKKDQAQDRMISSPIFDVEGVLLFPTFRKKEFRCVFDAL